MTVLRGQPLHLAADRTRLDRIRALYLGGRVLAAQKAILRTIEQWRDGRPGEPLRPPQR